MPYLFSSNDEKIDTTNFTYYRSGNFSDVYKSGDILLKIYKESTTYKYYMSRRLFLLLKKYNIPNLVKLIDYYHNYCGKVDKFLPMDAYTMEFVKDNKILLTEMSLEYIDKVVDMLEETLEELSKNHILIEDSHEGNILFTENGVTMLDPDQYLHASILTRNFIYQLNKEKIIKAMNDTINTEICNEGYRGFISYIYPTIRGSLTKDIKTYLKETEVKESIKKDILKLKK